MAWSEAARKAAAEARRRSNKGKVKLANGQSIGRRAFAKMLVGMRVMTGPVHGRYTQANRNAYIRMGAKDIAMQSRTGTTSVTTRGVRVAGGWRGRI